MSNNGVQPNGLPTPALVANDEDLADDLAACALDLARRFAAGATMWCVAPLWPEQARHVAVEFVHPVIVGKRALPAVSIDAVDPVGALRADCHSWRCRRGDRRRGHEGGAAAAVAGVGVGADVGVDRRRRASAGRFGRSRPVDRCRRRRRGTARRIGRTAVPPAVGVDARLFRARWAVRSGAGSGRWRSVHDVRGRGPPGRGAQR